MPILRFSRQRHQLLEAHKCAHRRSCFFAARQRLRRCHFDRRGSKRRARSAAQHFGTRFVRAGMSARGDAWLPDAAPAPLPRAPSPSERITSSGVGKSAA